MTDRGALLLAVAIGGCSTVSPIADAAFDRDVGTTDASVTPDIPSSSCMLGDGVVGHREGQVLPSLGLRDCDGAAVPLHDETFCDGSARFTVVSVAAGWCEPCQEESARLTAELTEPFRAAGVRVIQILVEDPHHGQPTPAFCDAWVAVHGLTNDMRIDPDRRAGVLWPDGVLPATYVIDREGIVRHRQNASDGIEGIVRAVQALLAEEP